MSGLCLPRKENLMNLGDRILCGMALYGYGDPLHHATAYVGFDASKDRFTNYFLCDGADDDVQIQLAADYADALGNGIVVLENNGTTYDVNAQIIVGAGVLFECMGSEINIEDVNDYVFVFHDDDTEWILHQITGIRDAEFIGDITNTSTWVAFINNINNGVIFENIQMYNVNNGFWIRGACYEAEVYNCNGAFNVGDFVYLEGFFYNAVEYSPDHAKINNCYWTGTASSTGHGVRIEADAGNYNPEGCVISNCWFENIVYGVLLNGLNHRVQDNFITCYAQATNYGVYIDEYAVAPVITGNSITAIDVGSSGIYNNATACHITITGNNFYYVAGKAINVEDVTCRLTVSGNTCTIGGASAYFVTGICIHSTITGNIVTGGVEGIGVQGTNTDFQGNVIDGNVFYGLSKGVYSVFYMDNCVIDGNVFDACTNGVQVANLRVSTLTDNVFHDCGTSVTPLVAATNIIRDNIGFVTENSGAAATIAAAALNTGAIAHGCAYTPTAADINVILTNLPTNDIGDVYLTAIGAANFTINCRNAPGVATAIFSWSVGRVY